jgi:predicted metal-binding membrane protein
VSFTPDRNVSGLEALLRQDRRLVAGGLAALLVLAWGYTLMIAGSMQAPHAMAMPQPQRWDTAEFATTFAMWTVMMAAMMTPAAAPVVLLFTAIERRRHPVASGAPRAAFFLAGYLVVWAGFSLAATVAQGALHAAALLSPTSFALAPPIAGAVLVAAGLYQFTSAKSICLARCRSPLDFLTSSWRDGRAGAFIMGVRHGGWCLGCCWALMSVLFAAGIMTVAWIALLALVVLGEKLLSAGARLRLISGALLAGWGVVLALTGNSV